MLLDHKIAIVTGAANGIGRAIALAMAGEGADIAIVDLTQDEAEGVASQIRDMGRRVVVAPADVSDSIAVRQVVDIVIEKFGRIDILVNDAGLCIPAPVLEVAEHDLRRVFEVDVFALSSSPRPWHRT